MTTHTPSPRNRVLVIGRSRNVLLEAVALLQGNGYLASATNQFDRVLDEYDVSEYDVVVFGGMVPPDTKQRLRDDISTRNETVVFVQGLAGIPGVIAAQVAETVGVQSKEAIVEYDASSRSIELRLVQPAHVIITAFWGTSFVPPEPMSTSMAILDDELRAGPHQIRVPDEVPAQASFATVSIGSSVWTFTVGAMPAGLTPAMLASEPDPTATL